MGGKSTIYPINRYCSKQKGGCENRYKGLYFFTKGWSLLSYGFHYSLLILLNAEIVDILAEIVAFILLKWSVLEKDNTLPERNREPRSIRSSAEKLHKVWCVLLLSINGIPKSFSFGILGSGQTSPQSKARHSLSSSLLQLLLRPLCADYKGDSNQCNGTSHTNPTKKERERVEKS